ncbi:MAG: relaxase domain-containing protein [Rhodocyclaceae bacterium]|nr:relaxase domain-containing protein [Rhodocyclaceae bacterium]
MINVKNVAAAQAESYYRADDYYTRGAPPAEWTGKGAARLGLSEANADRQFADLLRGKLPNGDEIAHGAGGKRRTGVDITISAPKSVSIAALVNRDERIIRAHREAVRAALTEVEARITARQTAANVVTREPTDNIVCRAVEHDTNRLGDPNLHSHCVLLNVTQRADGTWVAIENQEVYRAQRELDAVYKSELACRVASLGYQLRATRDGFELAFVTDAQIREYSRRKEDVDRALAERGLTREQSTAAERETAALDTRDRKQTYDREALVDEWAARGAAVGLDRGIPAGPLDGLAASPEASAREAVAFALAHLGEREMAWKPAELQRVALGVAWGSASVADIKREAARLEASGEIIRKADGTLTTKQGQALERSILDAEARGRQAVPSLANVEDVRRELEGSKLKDNDKQFAAVVFLMTTQNRVVGVQGKAGTGKTTLLEQFRRQAEAAGYRIEGVAPSHSAVKALGEAGIPAQTLQGWEVSGGKGLDARSIVLLDESSLASAKQVATVLRVAEAAGARVVLIGDSGQYQAVDAGKAFEQLQSAGMATTTVDKMLRQQTERLREVAQLSAEGKGREALAALGDSVKEIASREARHQAIAERYARMDAESRRECLVLTGSNADRQALNAAIRAELKLSSTGEKVEVFQREDLTAAEKRRAASFVEGQSLRFERDYKSLDFVRGEVVRVNRIDGNQLVVARADGRETRITPAHLSGKGLSVGRVETRELAAGDRIRITGNVATADGTTLRNGQRATVLAVEAGRLRVQVDGARKAVEIDARRSALSLDHGYAATGHSAQGLGARTVLLDRDSKSRTASERQFYTDVTRSKEQLEVFTDSSEKLAEAISRQVDKSVALEMPPAAPAVSRPLPARDIELER